MACDDDDGLADRDSETTGVLQATQDAQDSDGQFEHRVALNRAANRLSPVPSPEPQPLTKKQKTAARRRKQTAAAVRNLVDDIAGYSGDDSSEYSDDGSGDSDDMTDALADDAEDDREDDDDDGGGEDNDDDDDDDDDEDADDEDGDDDDDDDSTGGDGDGDDAGLSETENSTASGGGGDSEEIEDTAAGPASKMHHACGLLKFFAGPSPAGNAGGSNGSYPAQEARDENQPQPQRNIENQPATTPRGKRKRKKQASDQNAARRLHKARRTESKYTKQA